MTDRLGYFMTDSDYTMVDSYYYVADSKVKWEKLKEDGEIASGFITPDTQRGYQEKVGEEEHETPTYDEDGNRTGFETETLDVFETIYINVWDKLHQLESEGKVSIEPLANQLFLAETLEDINTKRDQLIEAGIEFNGHTFQTDSRSTIDLMGAVLTEEPTQWLTKGNEVVEMSPEDLTALGKAVAQRKKQLVYKAREHKDSIKAMNSREDIDNYLSNLIWE